MKASAQGRRLAAAINEASDPALTRAASKAMAEALAVRLAQRHDGQAVAPHAGRVAVLAAGLRAHHEDRVRRNAPLVAQLQRMSAVAR